MPCFKLCPTYVCGKGNFKLLKCELLKFVQYGNCNLNFPSNLFKMLSFQALCYVEIAIIKDSNLPYLFKGSQTVQLSIISLGH